MGNVAFTALARSLARQLDEDTVVLPPDHIIPESSGSGVVAGAAGGSVG